MRHSTSDVEECLREAEESEFSALERPESLPELGPGPAPKQAVAR
jgi:hypothetical protein